MALVSIATIPSWLGAQVAPALPQGVGEAIRINPFEVTQQVDDSFVTSSVGTGGRLVLELKDVPAAYFTINRSLIDALGITDVNEAASWAPGQSFDADQGSGNADGQYATFQQRGMTQLLTPNSTNSSGASTGVMRNFYQNQFSGNQDSYAVETFDFGQGPNGVLFSGSQSMGQFQASANAAGLAGVTSVQTKRARTDRTMTAITAELGAWDYRRVTIDHNRPINDMVSIRVNAVDLDSHGYMQHRENLKRGITVNTRFQFSPRTDLSIDISTDKSMVHSVVQPTENWSGWDGRTVARGLIDTTMTPTTGTNVGGLSKAYGQILGTTTPLTWGGEANGVTRYTGNANAYYWDFSTEGTIMNMRGMLVARRADSTTRVPLWSKTAPNGEFFVRGTRGTTTINGVSMARDVAFGVVNRSWLNLTGLPADMFDRAVRSSKARTLGIRENLTWEGPAQDAMNKDIQFSFSHRLNSSITLGLGGDVNRTQTDGRLMDRATDDIQLDLNQLLPNGTPNPHFLEMFAASQNDGIGIQHSITTDKALRANLAYVKNAGRWGDYLININGNTNVRTYDYGLYRLAITSAPNDPSLATVLKDPRTWASSHSIKMLLYDSYNKGYKEPRTPREMTLINSQWVGTGNESNTNAHVPTVTTSQATVAWTLLNFVPGGSGGQFGVIQDFAARNLAVQTTAKWMNSKIVFLGGFRRDFNSTGMQQVVPTHFLPGIDPIWRPDSVHVPTTGRWDGFTRYFKDKFPGTSQEYYALSYRTRDANGNPVGSPRLASTRPTTTISTGGLDGGPVNGLLPVADPRYTADRFRDDYGPPDIRSYANTKTYGVTLNLAPWFSPYINKSDQILPPNFPSASTTTPNLDLYGNFQDEVVGKGTDFGFRFNLLRGKIQGRYNYFDSVRVNNPAGNNVITQINNLINANRWNDTDTQNGASTAINQLGIAPLNTNGDYNTRGNFGWEAELNVQVARGLRVTANGSAASTYQDAATFYPLTKRYMTDPDRIAEFKALLEDAGGSLDLSQKPTSNGNQIDAAPGLAIVSPLAGKGVGIDTTNAVNAYNNIWIQMDQLGTNPTRTRSAPTANFVADYTFGSTVVRGLRIGAGVQWQGATNAGNYSGNTVLFTHPTLGVVAIDDPRLNNQDQFWRKGVVRTQANLAYTFNLRERGTLAVALRISNIGIKEYSHGLVLRQPQGDLTRPDRVQIEAGNPTNIQDPMNARLTLTYSFGGAARGGGR